MEKLRGKKVAILVTNGFEQVEMTSPRKALEEQGAITHIVSPESGSIQAWDNQDWGDNFEVDQTLDEANPADYDALLLPGGVMNPDQLRMNPAAVSFATHFMECGKPIAAICHGPWLLVETHLLMGRKMTSYPSIKTDLVNAGADWQDSSVVTDHGLVTSRKPADLKDFNSKMVEKFAKGVDEVFHVET